MKMKGGAEYMPRKDSTGPKGKGPKKNQQGIPSKNGQGQGRNRGKGRN